MQNPDDEAASLRGDIEAARQALAKARDEQAHLIALEEEAQDSYIRKLVQSNQRKLD